MNKQAYLKGYMYKESANMLDSKLNRTVDNKIPPGPVIKKRITNIPDSRVKNSPLDGIYNVKNPAKVRNATKNVGSVIPASGRGGIKPEISVLNNRAVARQNNIPAVLNYSFDRDKYDRFNKLMQQRLRQQQQFMQRRPVVPNQPNYGNLDHLLVR